MHTPLRGNAVDSLVNSVDTWVPVPQRRELSSCVELYASTSPPLWEMTGTLPLALVLPGQCRLLTPAEQFDKAGHPQGVFDPRIIN